MTNNYFEEEIEDDTEDEEEYPEKEECCPCGYFCFNCLGMTWADFM